MNASHSKIRFHSLDALRFFAFLKVYLLHVPLQGDFPIFSFLKGGGGIGVSFFFVLSGFLISYLLIFEKINHGQIDVKKFFIRRSLRIWPLFYLGVLLAFLLPYDFKQLIGMHMVGGGYEFDWRFSFTFLENYKMLLVDNSPKTTPISVFWSLCVEEHFYIVWLIALFVLPFKHILKFLIGCFVFAWIARFAEPMIWANQSIDTNDLFTNLDYFAGGGILGYWTAKDYQGLSERINNLQNWIKYTLLIGIILIVIFQKQVLPYDTGSLFFIFRSSIIAIMFTILIALFLPQNGTIRLQNQLLSYLGSISYGLYVYHILFVHILFQYFLNNNIKIDNWTTLSIFLIITFLGTVIVSIGSYHFFEKPFLILRERWTSVKK